MDANDRFWSRDQLYEEVWATPMRTIARKYGISDVGLAKICRKLMIPLPGRGHWAKQEAGHKVTREPLPAIKEPIRILKPEPRQERPRLQDFATEQERVQVEKVERASAELVLKRGSLSHPLIVQARAALGRATADQRNILETKEQCLDVRVSKASIDRALRIMAGLISAIEGEGFSVAVGAGHREATVATIHGQKITFGLVEKVDRIEVEVAPRGSVLERVLTFHGKAVKFEPSGKLSIEIWQPWDADPKRWRDRKSARIEEMLPEAVAGFIRIALAEKAEYEKRQAVERDNRRRAEERARLEQAIKAERSRVRALRHAAANWFRAEQMRSFISAAREGASRDGQKIEPGTPFGDWLAWAGQQADRLDPLMESPASVIDRIDDAESGYAGYYGYRKPEPPFKFPKPIWRLK
jgi:hypothetical protein